MVPVVVVVVAAAAAAVVVAAVVVVVVVVKLYRCVCVWSGRMGRRHTNPLEVLNTRSGGHADVRRVANIARSCM